MAKLVLLLVLACFQVNNQVFAVGFESLSDSEIYISVEVSYSLQEELGKPQFELIADEIPVNDVQLLDGEDKNQWHYQKDDDDVKPVEGGEENEWKYDDDDDDDPDWTESDEDWLQLLEELLEDNDEDYDEDSEELDKIIEEIDKLLTQKYPDDDDEWEDVLSKYPGMQGGKNSMNVYYSWLLRMKENRGNKKPISKRFSSV